MENILNLYSLEKTFILNDIPNPIYIKLINLF